MVEEHLGEDGEEEGVAGGEGGGELEDEDERRRRRRVSESSERKRNAKNETYKVNLVNEDEASALLDRVELRYHGKTKSAQSSEETHASKRTGRRPTEVFSEEK